MNHDMTRKTGAGDAADARGRVLGAIRERGLAMRPRWYFVLRGALVALSAVIVLLGGLYLASLVVFLMRHTGAWFVPAFGARGWLALLLSLPWALMVLLGLFVVVLELLVRRYAFAYRRPLLDTAIVLAILVGLGGIVVGLTPLHGRIARLTSEHEVPFLAKMYREFEAWHRDDVHRGTVARPVPEGFVFDEYDGDVLTVRVGPGTRIEGGAPSAGETVVVFGPEDDGAIEADGVRRIAPEDVE